ncbi:UNVERIFIED_CONTAM: tripartite tricarboxylate transporter substrate binding protein, partial [Bacillus mycoides]
MHKARRAALGLMASAALSAALPALAQEKSPPRPITFLVPFPPGGPTDAMARILAAELTKELGQS